jgi:hypothetical protein
MYIHPETSSIQIIFSLRNKAKRINPIYLQVLHKKPSNSKINIERVVPIEKVKRK